MFKKIKGFTLIELMLVIIGMTVILSVTLPLYLNKVQADKKEQLLNQHADMYKLLVNAVGSWANTSYADIDDDTRGQITIDDLKDDDYLPFQFAFQYSGTVAHDIMGLELKNWWNKSEVEWNGKAEQVIRTITTVDEAASWNSNPETFIPEKFATIESEEQYNTFVGSWYLNLAQLASERGLVAGRLKANSRTVVGVNQAWKIILDPNEFDIPTRPYQRIVFFWGWPDLNGFGGGVTTTIEPPITQANLYSGCYVTSRTYFQTVQQSSQCDNVSGYRSLIDLVSFSPSTPSPIYTVPGVGSIFSYVNRLAITDLSSIASLCYQRGNAYCAARSGGSQNARFCGTSDENRRTAVIQQCLSTPVYSVVNNVSFGGGIYKSSELYKDGSYNFGNVNGVNYEVDVGSELTYSQQYTFCCPNDVPDLEDN